MESPALPVLALAILAYGLASRHLRRFSLTAPIVFTALGLLIGPAALDLLGADIAFHHIALLAELTLILVLFADAAGIDLRLLHADEAVPARMLLLGLPLAVLLGTGAALLILPELGLWQAALLAALLAPTDAALARSVLVNDVLPARIRQTINAESGLNDGLALPLVFLFLALAGGSGTDMPGSGNATGWTVFFAGQIGLGLAVGAAAGVAGGWLVERAVKSGEMDTVFERLSAVAMALLAYGLAALVGGNGFIAAFTNGIAFGRFARRARQPVISFGETEGQLLALLTFVVFGAVLLPQAAAGFDSRMPVYGLVSLFLVRPLAIWLSLLGTGLLLPTKLFFGWFGPRGLASIVFVLIVEDRLGSPAGPLVATAAMTVGTSIVLHGLSAGPLARLYARRLKARGDTDALKEFARVEHGSDLRRSRH